MPSAKALANLDQFVEAIRTSLDRLVQPARTEGVQSLRLELTVDLEVLGTLETSAKTAKFSNCPASKLEQFAALIVDALGAGAKTLEVTNPSLKEKPNGH